MGDNDVHLSHQCHVSPCVTVTIRFFLQVPHRKMVPSGLLIKHLMNTKHKHASFFTYLDVYGSIKGTFVATSNYTKLKNSVFSLKKRS